MNMLAAAQRDEWVRRFAARLMDGGDMPEIPAMQCAAEAWHEVRHTLTADGSFITPEDAADEEMSQWEDDGNSD